MNNKELIQEYLEVEIDTENTRKAYRTNLEKFEQYIKGKNFLLVLPKDLKLYVKSLVNIYSQATINQITATLKDFYNYLYENEYMKKNISSNLGIIKSNIVAEPKEKEFLTMEEVKMLIKGIEEIDESSSRAKHKSFLKARDILILMLGCKLGLRESEIRETKLSDINLEKKIITIDGTRRKNKETLILPLDEELIRKINTYLIERRVITLDLDMELFVSIKGKKLFNSDMNRMIKKRCEQVGINSEDIHFHTTRHTASMILQQQGLGLSQVAKVLGQKSSNVTFSSYTHIDNEVIKEKTINVLG